MPAKKKVSETVEEAQEALMPTYDEKRLRGILERMRAVAKNDPRRAFGHPVGEQREMIAGFDELLCGINYLSRDLVEQAAPYPGLAVELERAFAEAYWNTRVCRSLSARLSGDDSANDGEVQEEVVRLLRERAEANAGQWDEEEQRAFATRGPRASAEFEAWLNDG